MSSLKQRKGGGVGRVKGVHPSSSDNSSKFYYTQSANVDVRVRERTESQTKVLFTSGAMAHYNDVNEEQMQLSEEEGGEGLKEQGAACPG